MHEIKCRKKETLGLKFKPTGGAVHECHYNLFRSFSSENKGKIIETMMKPNVTLADAVSVPMSG